MGQEFDHPGLTRLIDICSALARPFTLGIDLVNFAAMRWMDVIGLDQGSETDIVFRCPFVVVVFGTEVFAFSFNLV
jgi:hypothetical protein